MQSKFRSHFLLLLLLLTVGTPAAAVEVLNIAEFQKGNIKSTGDGSGVNAQFGLFPPPNFPTSNGFIVFDLIGYSGVAISGFLELDLSLYASPDATETFGLYDISTAGSVFIDMATTGATQTNVAAYLDTQSGNVYATRLVDLSDQGTILTIQLSPQAIADINNAAGGLFVIGFHLETPGQTVGSITEFETIRFGSGLGTKNRLILNGSDHSFGYLAKAQKGHDLPKLCDVTLDDPLFDFGDGLTTAENYTISKVKEVLLPADKNNEGVDDEVTHFVAYQIKPSKRSILPVGNGKFRKGRKHAKRLSVRIQNQFGDLFLDTIKDDVAFVPSAKSLIGNPDLGSIVDQVNHFKCYNVKATKNQSSAQTDAKGKFRKDLQSLVLDQFRDGAGHPSYDDAILYDLKKPVRLCNPIEKSNIELTEADAKGKTRETSCLIEPADIQRNVSLVCYQAKKSKNAESMKIDPAQQKHVKRVDVKFANQITEAAGITPQSIDTKIDAELCVPSLVISAGTLK